ncbi:MAG: hypothetical protein J0L66_12770 [Cytophagales bacterium]|nr:hypothetical protein [Cytophagales bacterium]
MDERIKLKAIEHYAIQAANQLAEGFFSRKARITGPEILSLCEVKQVNFFILHDLLTTWQQEVQNFKSPYFDYDAKPVAEALSQFQNTLSNHISIGKSDFLPLLKRGISQTLFLILDPYDFYAELLDSKTDPLPLAYLDNQVKYVKINKAPLEKLVARLKEKNQQALSGKEAFAWLDQILEEVNFTPEDVEPYLAVFGKIVPLQVTDFFEAKPVVVEPAPTPPVEIKQTELKPVAPVVSTPVTTEIKTTLADNLAKQKITRLKESLTINQKFMFTKVLFHGDFEIFTEAIEKLDRMDNMAQAQRFIDDGYPDWDREGEEYLEFLEIVQSRFR